MIKSAWAYKNGQRQMKQSEESLKQPEHSFINRRGSKLYAEKGFVKTYANKKQADNKVNKLKEHGYNVDRSFQHPFVIILMDK